MNIQENEISKWGITLDDFRPSYTPLKATTVLQYYQLRGRSSIICKANIEHIRYLKFCVYSPLEERYYLKEPIAFPLDVLYFRNRDTAWDSYDTALNNIHNYISDGNLWLLFTVQQVADTTAMLERLWKANLSGSGKLDYKMYLKILELSLQYEDYKDKDKGVTGYVTSCKQYENKIDGLWKAAYALKK